MTEWDKEIEAAFRDCMSSALEEMEAIDPTPAKAPDVSTVSNVADADMLVKLIEIAPVEAFQDPTFSRSILDAIKRLVKERDPYKDPTPADIELAGYARQIDQQSGSGKLGMMRVAVRTT